MNRWFWKSWSADYRVVGYCLGMLLIIALAYVWYAYYKGPSNVLGWETFQHQVTRETVSHTFELGNFEFSVPIESYLTFEYFNGTAVTPNQGASYFFLAGLSICALVLLSIITVLDRFWYFTGLGLFILFMVSLRLEVLRIFGFTGQTLPIVVISVFVLVSFYFQSFRKQAPFLLRLIVFASLTLLLALLVYFFANVRYPFLHLAVTGYVPGLILTVVFILMVAHEIMAGFIYVTSSGTSSSKSLRHFFIISVIYLVNLTLTYMHEARIIDWNFIYIDLYLLFSISAILGIWGFKHRENLYQNILGFHPLGAYFIISMASIAFLTTGLLLGNHNDAALRIIRDVIIFSHLGYGIIFFVYVVSNFIIMMAENLSAYKVLYRPTRMPYFTFRLAGLIATLAFVFYSNWRDYVYHGISGFYNHLGDLYVLLDRNTTAQAYYEEGRRYGFQNNRSNYTLGRIESHNNDFKKAHFYYELANDRRPTEFSLANDGNLLLIEGRTFEGISYLQRALKKKSGSGILQNNLGYAYSKIHKLDSALLFFHAAQQDSRAYDVAEANLIAIIGNEYLPVKADSLLRTFETPSPMAISNALAVASLQRQMFAYPVDILSTTKLDLSSATLLNNYLTYHTKTIDTMQLQQVFTLVQDSANADYSEALKATLAQAYYHQGNVNKALSLISELAFVSQIMQGKYNYLAGLWALEQGSPELAISYFDYAVMFNYKEARYYNTLALAEAGYREDALREADSLLLNKDETIRTIGGQLKKILSVAAGNVGALSDDEKYQYCRYRIHLDQHDEFNRVVNSIRQPELKVKALLERSHTHFTMGHDEWAARYLNQTSGIAITDRQLFHEIELMELLLLAAQNNVQSIRDKMPQVEFIQRDFLVKLLLEAKIAEAEGKHNLATANYRVLSHYNPFFEEGIMAAANYFRTHSDNDMHAYSILAEAIHINTTSYRLWMAYVNEALRVGFDNQANDAKRMAEELRARK